MRYLLLIYGQELEEAPPDDVAAASHAAYAALLSGAIYLSGGIIGTLHHLYFAGTPTVAIAFGAVFSARTRLAGS